MKLETKEEIKVDKLIFDFVYELALRDAVMRTAYLGDKNKLRENWKGKDIVFDYANKIINNNEFDYYDIAKKLCNSFDKFIDPKGNSKVQFNFGNAQKLLNMTMKYLYIMCYKNNELRKNFKNCHCPMDRIMIDKVKREFKSFQREEREKLKGKLKSISWSRLTFEDKDIYQQYQEAVKFLADKENLYPLEYDYFLWKKIHS